jgi:amino acid transporter
MTEQPRDWDKELADIDRAMAKQQPSAGGPVTAAGRPVPQRRFIALAWFWALLAVLLAVALIVWPFDENCGIRLIFFLGACLLTLLAGALGAFTSWAHRQGVAFLLSLLAFLFAGIMAAREILPRAGYARESLEWTCPPAPPAPTPAPPTSP